MASIPKKNPSHTASSDRNGTDGGSDAAPPAYNALDHDQSATDGRIPDDLGLPPSEAEIGKVNLTEAFDKLSLGTGSKYPDVDTCLAHLKLLFAFQVMKEEVGYTDGLWNIWDTRADDSATVSDVHDLEETPASGPAGDEASKKRLAILSKIREKRWAVFLARAVDRYEAWWTSMRAPNGPLSGAVMFIPGSDKYEAFTSPSNETVAWDATNLPPLGECSLLASAFGRDLLTGTPRRRDGVACAHAKSAGLPRRLHACRI